jgi:hypothetical protein
MQSADDPRKLYLALIIMPPRFQLAITFFGTLQGL